MSYWIEEVCDTSSYWKKVECPNCRNFYEVMEEDQVIGCKSMDYEICPYCKNENRRSMSVEFTVRKLNGEGFNVQETGDEVP